MRHALAQINTVPDSQLTLDTQVRGAGNARTEAVKRRERERMCGTGGEFKKEEEKQWREG